MLAPYAYDGILTKTVLGFGMLFNGIYVRRKDNNGVETELQVPITYAPKEKFFRKLKEPSAITAEPKVQITIPSMSYIITSTNFDGERRTNKIESRICGTSGDEGNVLWSPVPTNVVFNLFIYTRHINDTLQIVEQIVPYFNPEQVIEINYQEGNAPIAVPVSMGTGVILNERYDGDFENRRVNISSIAFTARTYMFVPVERRKVIVDLNATVEFDDS